jgi:hypothetical protein
MPPGGLAGLALDAEAGVEEAFSRSARRPVVGPDAAALAFARLHGMAM